jgi:apolipoprotein N-acyltransferase
MLLSLFPAIALFAAKKIFPDRKLSSMLGFSVMFAIAEWLRGHLFTGFPWNLPAYAWTDVLPIVQTVSLGGAYMLSLLTIFWGTATGFIFVKETPVKVRLSVILASLITLTACYVFGTARLAGADNIYDRNMTVQLVQPSILQADKWDPDKVWNNFRILTNLSYPSDQKKEVASEKLVTLVVWPETAVSERLLKKTEARVLLQNALKAHSGDAFLVTGSFREKNGKSGNLQYANSMIVLNEQLEVIAEYDKSHLVPFGEYIPFKELIPIKPVAGFSGMSPGKGPVNLKLLGKYVISPVICYEIIFPGTVTPGRMRDTMSHMVVNLTNDAWYGNSSGPHQHFSMAIFRAVEEGMIVIRSANTGISGIIDPYGKIVTRIPLNKRNTTTIYPMLLNTSFGTNYSRIGDLLFWFLCIIFLGTGFHLQYFRRANT